MPRITSANPRPQVSVPVKISSWSYGVMTVQSRINTTLPRTLASMKAAGFDAPRLFVDGCTDLAAYEAFKLDVTIRSGEPGRIACNWSAGMVELYTRKPDADAYLMIQDDVLMCKDLRTYLESKPLLTNAYFNLYTARANQRRMDAQGHKRGWYTSNQSGFGALALLFTRDALVKLFTSTYFVMRPQDKGGHKAIDGGIVTAMREVGYKEYVHKPGLVQHTGGDCSTVGHKPARNWDAESPSFLGESTSALTLL